VAFGRFNSNSISENNSGYPSVSMIFDYDLKPVLVPKNDANTITDLP
jgi:hypothetical protein